LYKVSRPIVAEELFRRSRRHSSEVLSPSPSLSLPPSLTSPSLFDVQVVAVAASFLPRRGADVGDVVVAAAAAGKGRWPLLFFIFF
jgi:hypothetical protein